MSSSVVKSSRSTVGEKLRTIWPDLISRLDPEEIVDELFAHRIIAQSDMDKIMAEKRTQEQARELMNVVLRRPVDDVRKFAEVLISSAIGMKDLGEDMLRRLEKEHEHADEIPYDPTRSQAVVKSLRPIWTELNNRLDPDSIVDDMFTHKIISVRDMDKIKTLASRRDKASQLLSVVIRRSVDDVKKFAELLIYGASRKKDLGDYILRSLEKGFEHSDLRPNNSTKQRKSLEFRNVDDVESKQLDKESSESTRRQTLLALGHREVAIRKHCKKQSISQWSLENEITVEGPDTNDCLAIVGNQLYASSRGSSTIQTTWFDNKKLGSWKAFECTVGSIQSHIRNPSGPDFYTCLSTSERQYQVQIYKCQPREKSFQKITPIEPMIVTRRETLFNYRYSLAASDTRLLLVQCNGYDAAVAREYDLEKDYWLEKTVLPFSCWDCSVTSVDDKYYVLGTSIKPVGDANKEVPNIVALYRTESTWKTHLPPVPQNHAKIVADRGKHLIAVGGRYGEDASKNVRLLDPLSRSWLKLPQMNGGHYRFGVDVTEDNDLVVLGGYQNSTTEVLSVPDSVLTHSYD